MILSSGLRKCSVRRRDSSADALAARARAHRHARERDADCHFGYRTAFLKILVLTLAGAVACLGGLLAAVHEGFVSSPSVGVVLSTQAVIKVLLGGAGTRIGAILGVLAIEGMSYWLSDNYRQIWPIILALLLLLAIVMLRPSGLISFVVTQSERAGSFGARLRRRA